MSCVGMGVGKISWMNKKLSVLWSCGTLINPSFHKGVDNSDDGDYSGSNLVHLICKTQLCYWLLLSSPGNCSAYPHSALNSSILYILLKYFLLWKVVTQIIL